MQEAADEFYRTYNNAQFNSIEPDLCHLAYVERVEVLTESQVCNSFKAISYAQLRIFASLLSTMHLVSYVSGTAFHLIFRAEASQSMAIRNCPPARCVWSAWMKAWRAS